MSNHHITQPFSIEFLGVARSGKSTTARKLLESLAEKGYEFADYSVFQNTNKFKKYKLITISLLTKLKRDDFSFAIRYLNFFLHTICRPQTKLDKVRILHPLKYYLITNHLINNHKMSVVEDGATHICAGYQKVNHKLHQSMLGSKSILIVVNDVEITTAIARVEADEPDNVPWIVTSKEELLRKYEHHLKNQEELLNSLGNGFVNIRIMHINALDKVEKKVNTIIDFIEHNIESNK